MPILGNFPGGGTASSGLQLYPATGVQTIAAGERAYIKWTDPNDIVADGNVLAEWGGTVLVRKAGSAPISRRDGVIILDSKTRNAYKDTYFCDNGLTNGVQYFYRIFPYTKDGAYTDDEDSYTVTPSPVKVGSVIPGSVSPAGYGKVSVSWEDPEPYTIIDGVTVAEWETTYVTLRKGAIPCTSLDQIDVDTNIIWYNTASRNTFKDTPLVIDGLDNGSAYAVSFFAVTTEWVWSASKTTYPFLGVTPNRIQIERPELVQMNELTYTGEPQDLELDPSVDALIGEKITVNDGALRATNAGQYTVSFVPQNDYMWDDGTRDPISAIWEIKKAASKARLTATIEDSAGNQVYASDNVTELLFDDNYYYANLLVRYSETNSVSKWDFGGCPDNMLTYTIDPESDLRSAEVYIEGQGSGSYNLTITIPEGANYLGKDIVIPMTFDYANIYGAEWLGTSDPKWYRTDAAADFVDPTPAVNNGTGSSPFDNIMPWCGMERVTDQVAGELVKIPKYWYRWTRADSKMKLQIADRAVIGFHTSPAHDDRGDGNGERGTVYVGRYHCVNGYRSANGAQPLSLITRAAARSGIHNLGSNIWQYDYAMYWTIAMLYLVEFADWNSQKTIGYGCSPSGSKWSMGYTDSMQYHTGTSAESRTTYGGTQYRYVEGLWDNVFDWCDGIYFSTYGRVYHIKNPADFSDDEGGTLVSAAPLSSTYITKWCTPTDHGFEYALFPISSNSGGYEVYVCDRYIYGNKCQVLACGGYYDRDGGNGMFGLCCNRQATAAVDFAGCRLQKLP